jgi:hypothetical protein
MKRHYYFVFFSLLLIAASCKKTEEVEKQGPDVFQLQLSQTEISVNAGEESEVDVTILKDNQPFDPGFDYETNYTVTVVENNTNDSAYSFAGIHPSIRFVAPQKPGTIKVAVQLFLDGIKRAKPAYLTVNVVSKPVTYDFLIASPLGLTSVFDFNAGKYYSANGFLFNLNTNQLEPIDYSAIRTGAFLDGISDEGELLFIRTQARAIVLNTSTNQAQTIPLQFGASKLALFRKTLVYSNDAFAIGRILPNGNEELFYNIRATNIIQQANGFIAYGGSNGYAFATDTSTTYNTFSLPEPATFVTKINGKHYLVGNQNIYSSINGINNWVKIGLIPKHSSGSTPNVYVTVNGFYFAFRFEKTIYITSDLNTVNYVEYKTPVSFIDIEPLPNKKILFTNYFPVITGVFNP